MPQLIGLVLVGAGVLAGIRAVSRLVERMSADVHRAEAERSHAGHPSGGVVEKDLGALEYDPESGVYKPRASRTS